MVLIWSHVAHDVAARTIACAGPWTAGAGRAALVLDRWTESDPCDVRECTCTVHVYGLRLVGQGDMCSTLAPAPLSLVLTLLFYRTLSGALV